MGRAALLDDFAYERICEPLVGCNLYQKVLFRTMAWLGAAFLLLCGVLCAQVVTQTWPSLQPLSFPVSLRQGIITTPEFRTDIKHSDYEIDLGFDPRLLKDVPTIRRILANRPALSSGSPFLREMMCILGAEERPEQCGETPGLIDVSWKLYSGPTAVADGSSRSFKGLEDDGGEILRILGVFSAEKGNLCRIVLQVDRDASELNIANSRIIVRLPASYRGDIADANGILILAAALSGILGLSLLSPTIARHIERKRLRGSLGMLAAILVGIAAILVFRIPQLRVAAVALMIADALVIVLGLRRRRWS